MEITPYNPNETLSNMYDIDSLFTIEKPINNPIASPSPTHREDSEDARDTLLNSPISPSFDTPERPKIPATHSSSPTEIIEPAPTSESVHDVNISKSFVHPVNTPLRATPNPKPLSRYKQRIKTPAQSIRSGKTATMLALAATTTLTTSQIAKQVGVSGQAAHMALATHGVETNRVELFKKNRADVFATIQCNIAGTLSNEAEVAKINIATARDLKDAATALAIIYDKEQLERGRPTSITDYRGITLEVKGTLEDIEKALNLGQGDKDEPVDL